MYRDQLVPPKRTMKMRVWYKKETNETRVSYHVFVLLSILGWKISLKYFSFGSGMIA